MNNNCYNSIKQTLDDIRHRRCCPLYIPGPTGPTGPAGTGEGVTGPTGPAPTLEIGTVTTGEPGTEASVTITPIN